MGNMPSMVNIILSKSFFSVMYSSFHKIPDFSKFFLSPASHLIGFYKSCEMALTIEKKVLLCFILLLPSPTILEDDLLRMAKSRKMTFQGLASFDIWQAEIGQALVSHLSGSCTNRISTNCIGTICIGPNCIGNKLYREQTVSGTYSIGNKLYRVQFVSGTNCIGSL